MLRRWRQRVTFIDIVVWAIGIAIGAAVIYGTIVTWRAAEYSPEQWINLTIDGLKARRDLRSHRSWLHPGIWHSTHDQFRSQRSVHGRTIYCSFSRQIPQFHWFL